MVTMLALMGLQLSPIRPPAVPLVVHDPYFSIWSPSEVLSAADTRHWTGAAHQLFVFATIDGHAVRLVGKSRGPSEAMKQTALEVFPTRTLASFQGHGVDLQVTFLTPALPEDLDLYSQPLTYLRWTATSNDGHEHHVAVTVEASARIAASADDQPVNLARETVEGLQGLSAATANQPVLAKRGDAVQIDWGTFFLAAPKNELAPQGGPEGRAEGAAGSTFLRLEYAPVTVGAGAQDGTALLCYDDEFSIQYFGQNLRPYWRRNGATGRKLLSQAMAALPKVQQRCEAFDKELLQDLNHTGGPLYTQIAALAYRQCAGGCKLVADPNGQPLWFPKENTSNGCIATVDVIYPMSPQALLFGPALTKALLMPVLAYSASPRWKFPFAPHDLGTYPQANGQAYGGGERSEQNQMPVEESANMLILVAALAKVEGNAEFARSYWPQLTQWAEYLKAKGLDPENQLCTDDFLGHLAHNVNLSAKAVVGLRSFGYLATLLGKQPQADVFNTLAREFAKQWVAKATSGGHTALTFDRPDTWSQKYNLVWDRILGFGLFPNEVLDREMAWYRRHLLPYGLPLDSRGTGAKLDWSVWTATLTQRRKDFDALIAGVYRYVDESPQRVGMGDWYDTAKGHFNFMHSRPVVGGVLLPLLYDEAVWKKWAGRGTAKTGEWAPLPAPPVIMPLVPSSETQGVNWRYTLKAPPAEWFQPGFQPVGWKSGPGGFGAEGTPGAVVRTPWTTSDIWLMRTFELSGPVPKDVQLWLHHDDDVEVYLNGVLALERKGWTNDYEAFALRPEALAVLHTGENTLAIHCHQNRGGQYIDAGLVRVSRLATGVQ